MRTYIGSSIQQTFAVTIAVIAAMWLVAVPAVLTMPTFLALIGVMMAAVWAGTIAYGNGQAPASVVHLLHDTERGFSLRHPRDNQ